MFGKWKGQELCPMTSTGICSGRIEVTVGVVTAQANRSFIFFKLIS